MRYLILGGTGTLGRALTRELLSQQETKRIICFSRDELKQKEVAAEFPDPRLQFVLGDIRDPAGLWQAMVGMDAIFHVAALKHIDTLESNPEESVRTNIIGTVNIADGAIRAGVKHVIFSSTDKAESPVNVYGMSKGISEKILLNRNKVQSGTKFSVYRWGNVLGSRGSVIHSFAKTIREHRTAYITDPEMTRFWIKIEDAVKFMTRTYASSDGIMVPEMKAARVSDMAVAIAHCVGDGRVKFEVTGLRPGEKIHESILPNRSSQDGPFFETPELVEFVRPIL